MEINQLAWKEFHVNPALAWAGFSQLGRINVAQAQLETDQSPSFPLIPRWAFPFHKFAQTKEKPPL